jgi:hypothetical protein
MPYESELLNYRDDAKIVEQYDVLILERLVTPIGISFLLPFYACVLFFFMFQGMSLPPDGNMETLRGVRE